MICIAERRGLGILKDMQHRINSLLNKVLLPDAKLLKEITLCLA